MAAMGGDEHSSLWLQDLINGLSGMTFRVKHAVSCDASPFQKVEVFDTQAYGRVLLLAGNVVLTERDEFIYSEMLAHPALCIHPRPVQVCIIGGGDGGVAREALKHPTVEKVTVVEIDSLVTETVKEHFSSLRPGLTDARTEIVFEDGHRFLEQSSALFDVILVDSYDPGGPVQSLTAEPFYPLVHERLTDQGIAVFQTGSPTVSGDALRDAVRNVSAIYAQHRPYLATLPSFPEGTCSFVAAAKAEDGLQAVDEKRCAAVSRQCRCYNRELHDGAFMLPQYVREVVKG